MRQHRNIKGKTMKNFTTLAVRARENFEVEVEIEATPDGYRRATLVGPYGAFLLVRPDGSHAHSNVNEDSEIYAALNSALFTSKD
jgi:hypothetical protein